MNEIKKNRKEAFTKKMTLGEEQPNAITIIDDCGKKVLMYPDFIALTDIITFKLKEKGVRPRNLISIMLRRIAEHMADIIGLRTPRISGSKRHMCL